MIIMANTKDKAKMPRKASSQTKETTSSNKGQKASKIAPDILAVIAMALIESSGLEETMEPRKLTIKHAPGCSSWSLKSHNMREKPTLIEY